MQLATEFLGGTNLFKAFLMLSSGSVVGKIIGFLREVLMAALFGTGTYVGAYRVAQTAMLMPVELFLTNSLEAGFVPLYVRYAKDDPKRAQAFLSGVMMLFLLLAAAIFLFLLFGSFWWVGVLAPGMDATSKVLTASMLRVMALAVPLYVLGMSLSYLEMAYGKYIAASFRSTVQSFGLIVGALLAFYFKVPVFLAWGFTWAYGAYFLWILARLWNSGILRWPAGLSWSLIKETLEAFWRCVRPVLFVPLLIQGDIAIERIVASLLGIGVIAALDYAKFITETGVILVAAPLSMVGLSTLSGLDPDLVHQRVVRITEVVLILTIPVSLFVLYYRTSIVHVLYARGAFDRESVITTSGLLFGFALGLWAQILSYYLIRILNTQLRNTEVLLYLIIAILLGIGAKLLLYKSLGPAALGLGTSVNSMALCFLTMRALKLDRALCSNLLWMGVGSIFYVVVCSVVSLYIDNISHISYLALAIGLFLLFWTIYVFLVPQLRLNVYFLLKKLCNLIKR